MTSSSMRGTRRLAGQSPSTGLPITPPVIPIVPIVPIVPVGPTPPSPRTPAPIVPPISPGEMEIAVTRMRRLAFCFSDLGEGLANGREPFGDPRPARRRRLHAGGMICGRARRHCAEKERDTSRSGGNNPGQDPTVFLPQRHEIPLHRRPRDRRVYSKAWSAGSNLPDLTAPERYRLDRARLDRRFTSCATNSANHCASRCANCPTRRYAIRRCATNFPRPAAVRFRPT
jgi:hypothetical protein